MTTYPPAPDHGPQPDGDEAGAGARVPAPVARDPRQHVARAVHLPRLLQPRRGQGSPQLYR